MFEKHIFEKHMQILSGALLFRGIEKSDLNSMLQCLRPKVRSYKKDEFVTIAGDIFEGIGLILTGEATVSKENASGDRVMLSLLAPGDMFGEIVAFSGQSSWPATVQAQAACEVLFLPREKIVGECEKVCPWHKTLIQNMLKIVSERALMLNKKVDYLTIKSMRGKICAFILEQYKKTGNTIFTLDMNRNELADFLNVSRPSMSREMCKMRDEGVIDFHLSSIRILNLKALKESCSL